MPETTTTLETALEGLLRRIVREEIQAALACNGGLNVRAGLQPARLYLTVKEAADFARLSPSTIRLVIRQRKLKALKAGSRVIIKRVDLENYLEANPVETVDYRR